MAYVGFDALKAKVGAGGAKNPGAVAAAIGRKKYGKGKFQKAAAKGTKMMGMASLSKKPKKVCTSILKDSLSCGKKIIASFKSFGHENCEVISKTPDSRRECKSDINDLIEELDSGLQGARLTGIAGCESWEGACIETCDAPL